jgi:hypothetical protein
MTNKFSPAKAHKADSLRTLVDNSIHDYYSRADEHSIKVLDESYQFAWREKENLTTKYNSEMFDFIDRIYVDEYDKGVSEGWRTNDNVELVQKYLNDIGHANIEVDGMYGEDTKKALKNYLYEFSGKHMWESMKSGAEKIWEPGEDVKEDLPFYDWK